MSLINDALKKAQRLRHEEPTGTLPPTSGAGAPRVAKRSQPRTSQQVVILAAAVVVLVVLTVVATVWLVNRPAPPKPTTPVATAPAKPKPAADTPAAVPVIITLANKPATAPLADAPATKPTQLAPPNLINLTPSASVPAPATPIAAATEPAAAPSPEAKPVVAPPPPAAEPKPDEHIHAFVDAIRVTGIRSSGDDSRVLMNDRVFRVNDIVDRGLGVRLTKVNPNSLTFTDSNGATYVKNF